MTIHSVIETYFKSVNEHDWVRLEEIFDPNVVVQHGMEISAHGSEKAIKLLTAVVRQFEQHEDIPVRTIVDGKAAAVEIEFEGILNGQEIRFEAVDFFDINEGRITKVASWYDTAFVLPKIQAAKNS